MNPETLVFQGGAVKALDGGKVGGYLVLFSTDKDPDLAGDFFTPDTDFDVEDGAKTAIYYDHAMDRTIKSRKLATGALKIDDIGVWVEAQLELRDEYEQAIYDMAKAGKLGWSSGTASHLVEREASGKAMWIKRWPLGLDASLTTTPCEPRTQALPLKSIAAERKAAEGDKNYFGSFTEADMSVAALRSLNNVLMYQAADVLYGYCYDDSGNRMEPADRLKIIEGMFAEFEEIACRVLGAMLGSAKTAEEAAKSIKALWLDPEDVKGALPDGVPFMEHSRLALAAVEGWKSRLAGLIELRRRDRKSGRVISQANHDRMKQIHESISGAAGDLGSLLEETTPEGANAPDEAAEEAKTAAREELRRKLLLAQAEMDSLTI